MEYPKQNTSEVGKDEMEKQTRNENPCVSGIPEKFKACPVVRPNAMSTYALVKEKIEDGLTQIKVGINQSHANIKYLLSKFS